MDDESRPNDRSRLTDGERVLLLDAKERRYLITLRAGTKFHTHVGIVAHDDLIGAAEGSTVLGSTGRRFVVVRPTLSDVVLKMPRGAQVIYPKDLGAILMQADVGPGMRVLEAGVGSGALSMTLLRAGAIITAYEIREDFALHAQKNVRDMLGDDVAYDVKPEPVPLLRRLGACRLVERKVYLCPFRDGDGPGVCDQWKTCKRRQYRQRGKPSDTSHICSLFVFLAVAQEAMQVRPSAKTEAVQRLFP